MSETSSSNPRRRRRWPWILLGSATLLLVAAALILPGLLDPESHRGRIEAALREATGWDAELGAIDFSVLQGLVLQVSPARLAAPGDGSSVDIESIEIRAELMPLLSGRLAVRGITLVRPEIRLVRNDVEAGWVLPVRSSAEPGVPVAGERTGSSGEPPGGGGAANAAVAESDAAFEVSVDRVRVKDGRVRVEDRAAEPPLIVGLEGVDASLSPESGELSGGGRLIDSGGRLAWRGNVRERFTIELKDVRTELLHPFVGADLVHGGGRFSGEIDVSQPFTLEGRLNADELTLIAGERPFERAELSFRLAESAAGIQLDSIEFDGDGARLSGGGALSPALALELQLAETPLDVALRATESVLPLPLDLTPPGQLSATLRVDQPAGGELSYEAEGALTAAAFRPGEMLPVSHDLSAAFTLDRSGVLEIRVLDGTVAGGPLRGTARLASIDPPGRLTFDGGIQQAVLGQLLGDMVGDSAGRVTGATGIGADVALDLSRPEIDARALSGRLEFDSRQVSLPGWDLENAIRGKLEQRLGGLTDLAALFDDDVARKLDGGAAARQAGDVVEQLLESMEATVDFDSWPWKLERLALAAEGFSATGDGTFDPIQGLVDLRFTSRLSRQRTAQLIQKHQELRPLVDGQGQLSVPLRLDGALLSPTIHVNIGELIADEPEKAVEGLIRGLLDRKKKKKKKQDGE